MVSTPREQTFLIYGVLNNRNFCNYNCWLLTPQKCGCYSKAFRFEALKFWRYDGVKIWKEKNFMSNVESHNLY